MNMVYKYQRPLSRGSFAEAAMASLILSPFKSFLPRSFLSHQEDTNNNQTSSLISFIFSHFVAMKLAASLNSKFLRLTPKRIFRSKSKASVVSRSEPSSFSSGVSSCSSDASFNNLKPDPATTPISVLPDNSGDFYSDLIQAFKLIDRDDDGVVSRRDLAALLSRLSPEPPSQEEVSLMLREVDAGGDDGCISLEELASRVAGTSGEGSIEMREVFEFFDADRDGRISAEELHRVFGVIGDERCTMEECVRMIATVDGNGDGFVCFDDFCRMMELQAPAMNDHH